MDTVSLSSLGAARRTRAGAGATHSLPSAASVRARSSELAVNDNEEEFDEFHATPPLTPVSRAKQAAVLAASFGAIALTIGYNQCYGVFQEYYLSNTQDVLSRGSASEADPPTALLAFVGTLGAGLTWAGSIFVNPWLSRVEHAALMRQADGGSGSGGGTRHSRAKWLLQHALSPRGITLAGVALMALGFLLASFASQVWQLLLTQGLLYGVGSSMLYFPLLGPAPEYFTRHRATALGLILSGGGVGSVGLTQVVRALLSRVGGRWTLRVLAGLYMVVGMPIAWAVPRSRFPVVAVPSPGGNSNSNSNSNSNGEDAENVPPPPVGRQIRRRTHVSAALLATPAFLLSVAAAFCQAAGAQLPLTFIPSYSVTLGLSAGTGATLLAVANIVNAASRIATGYAGDRFGRLNVLTVSLAGAAAAVGALWGLSVKAATAAEAADTMANAAVAASSPYQLWLAFVVLYSVAAGGYYALFPATIADVFGIRSYAAVNGFIYFVRGCGTMLGSPVGGVLLGKGGSGSSSSSSATSGTGGSGAYADVIVWDGALLVGSALCVLGVRWADALRRGWAWRA